MKLSFLKEKGSKYIVWILLGILVLVMVIPMNESEIKNSVGQSEVTAQGELEEKLKNILSVMEGVGNVDVMITTKESGSDLFSDDYEDGEVLGVAVVAQGAGNPTVDAKIMMAVKALFGLEAHKISIVKMRPQEDGK